ncbi:hypothetical protein KC573_00980 [candidate division WWE3 bacterium]|uniref:Cell division protein FtsL n=1 Tax=candidate division WWE3 bacterium TaxID=2053526 RepID=A0A955RWL6_UNCKA|nr:hypothetical protein [candidate division WWE3 bacterium]
MQQIELRKHTVPGQVEQTSGKIKILLAILLGLGGVTFGLQIWLSGQIATAGEDIHRLEAQKDVLELENARLTEKMNEEITLAIVEEKAKEMGFVKVHPDQIEFVDSLESFASLSTQ